MNKKYKILSVSSYVPLLVSFKDESKEGSPEVNIGVKIDYKHDKVYFDALPDGCEDIDLVSLEEQILNRFRPPHVEIPDVYYEYLSKIQEVRSSDYATSFTKKYENGEN